MLKQESSVPLFQQIKADIKHNIIENKYKHGEKLPSELVFCEMYGVSRITIRKAIQELEQENIVMKKQGKGTFVIYNTINTQINQIEGFSYSFSEGRKKDRSSVLISKKIVPATPAISAKLQIPVGTDLIEIVRVLSEKDIPILLDTVYMQYEKYPIIFKKVCDNVSLYKLLYDNYGVIFSSAYKEMSASICNEQQSKYLKCPVGKPLIDVAKILYNQDNVPNYISNLNVLSGRAIYSVWTNPNDENVYKNN